MAVWGRWAQFLPAAAPVLFFVLAVRSALSADETGAIAMGVLALVSFGLWLGYLVAGRRQTRF